MKNRKLLQALFAFLLMLLLPVSKMNAQENGFFDCSEFYSDVKTFNAIEDYTNRSRAKGIMEMGKMNSEKAIHWQYVITAQDTINTEQFMKTIKRWQNQAFKSDQVVKDESDHHISILR